LRPGRLDRLIYVAPPDCAARKEILQILFHKMRIADDVSIESLVTATEGCSGAEISALCQQAGLCAMREKADAPHVALRHFENALPELSRQITIDVLKLYEDFKISNGR